MSKEHLGTYLNDHLMGSVAALEIVDQFITEDQDLRPFLTELKTEIEADRDELVKIMHRLDISESRIRRASGWLAEQVAEFNSPWRITLFVASSVSKPLRSVSREK